MAAEARLRLVMVNADRAAGSLDRDDAPATGHFQGWMRKIDSRIGHFSLFSRSRGRFRMATLVADTACVDPRADIADDVEIGPYSVIGPDVKIGRGTRLIAHACIQGMTDARRGQCRPSVRGHRRRTAGRLVPRQPDPRRDRRQ